MQARAEELLFLDDCNSVISELESQSHARESVSLGDSILSVNENDHVVRLKITAIEVKMVSNGLHLDSSELVVLIKIGTKCFSAKRCVKNYIQYFTYIQYFILKLKLFHIIYSRLCGSSAVRFHDAFEMDLSLKEYNTDLQV